MLSEDSIDYVQELDNSTAVDFQTFKRGGGGGFFKNIRCVTGVSNKNFIRIEARLENFVKNFSLKILVSFNDRSLTRIDVFKLIK